MNFRMFPLLLITTFTCAAAVYAEDKNLFSGVDSRAVYSPNTTESTSPVQRRTPREGKGPRTLEELLLGAGFNSREHTAGGTAVSLSRADGTASIVLTLSADQTGIQARLMLGTLPENSAPSASRLLALMQASREHSPAAFTYDSTTHRLELCQRLTNDSRTMSQLRSELENLATIAEQTKSLWQELVLQSSVTSDSSKTLTGKWVAVRSSMEAFAAQFQGDGTFQLVHVSGQKQIRSRGSFSLQEKVLTLTENDGTKRTGTIIFTAKGFQLAMIKGNVVTAKLEFERTE